MSYQMPLVWKAEAMVIKKPQSFSHILFSQGFTYANMFQYRTLVQIFVYILNTYIRVIRWKTWTLFAHVFSEDISPYPCQNTRWMVILSWLLRLVQIIGAKVSSVKKDHSPRPVEISRMLKSVNFWMIHAEQKRLGAWFLKWVAVNSLTQIHEIQWSADFYNIGNYWIKAHVELNYSTIS